MSRFRRTGVRCDGCGRISMDRSGNGGYIRSDGTGGNITSRGRDCPHDWCDECDQDGVCLKCGARQDGNGKWEVA